MTTRRKLALLTLLLLTFGAFAATAAAGTAGSQSTVRFRIWDDQVAKAYRSSIAQFEKAHPNIKVQLEVVPWADYWTKLPTDLAAGSAPDLFWLNSSNFALLADRHQIQPLDSWMRSAHISRNAFFGSQLNLYTRDGKLYGIPQLWDSIALFYNKALVQKAGVNVNNLTWSPSGKGDTFLAAARKLTVDGSGKTAAQTGFDPKKVKTWGFNASNDLQAIYLDFWGSNGVQMEKGDQLGFDTPAGVAATTYIVDLLNRHHVAPPASTTNGNGSKTLELFVSGKMALFQSGPYNLKSIQEGAKFKWGIAPMLKGPRGRLGVKHAVVTALSAKSGNMQAAQTFLAWLASSKGQLPIAAGGYGFPGARGANSAFSAYWKKQGVNIQPFIDQAAVTAGSPQPPRGPKVQAEMTAYDPVFQEMFLGRLSVADALKKAQDEGNNAAKD